MNKRIISFLTVIVLAVLLAMPVYAANNDKVVDNADKFWILCEACNALKFHNQIVNFNRQIFQIAKAFFTKNTSR